MNAAPAVAIDDANGIERKKRRSTRGSFRRGSYSSRPRSAAPDAENAARMAGEDQPAPGASMNPYVSAARKTITSTWPAGSNRRGLGAIDSGTKRSVRRIAARPTGTVTQKLARHPIAEPSVPPTTGPSAMETPNTAPQMPTACARSRGSENVFVTMDMATGSRRHVHRHEHVLRPARAGAGGGHLGRGVRRLHGARAGSGRHARLRDRVAGELLGHRAGRPRRDPPHAPLRAGVDGAKAAPVRPRRPGARDRLSGGAHVRVHRGAGRRLVLAGHPRRVLGVGGGASRPAAV